MTKQPKRQAAVFNLDHILDLDDEETEEMKVAIAAGVSACHGGEKRAFWHEGSLYVISMTIAHSDAIDHEDDNPSLRPYSVE